MNEISFNATYTLRESICKILSLMLKGVIATSEWQTSCNGPVESNCKQEE